jgi:hypothetical protein
MLESILAGPEHIQHQAAPGGARLCGGAEYQRHVHQRGHSRAQT